ncbi:ABC transporter ATP-binding protein [Saccharothrix sp. S26]|uniref:ABC transporter ATP-binding protein n=1 Tax=Saccharothrix sp. S26 TaxID=2907215 RepID=UPI00227975F4|nr:ABC transporter ATP-binding protein [Saccharothrix sp. S26]
MTHATAVRAGAALAMRDLHKAFGEVRAVDGVDLTVSPGEVVALLGPNGAGKSTTVDMLLGLSTPDRGEVTVFGRTPRQAVAEGVVGAMLQSGVLLDDATVAETVGLIAALHRRPLPVAEVLDRAGVGELADRRCTKLSGGQKQRVRFALALVCDPDLLVLDEPTVAMDVETRRQFWQSMREYTGGDRQDRGAHAGRGGPGRGGQRLALTTTACGPRWERSSWCTSKSVPRPAGQPLTVPAVVAAMVTIGASAPATGLTAADGRGDLATPAAVGASPRLRRVLSLSRSGVIAGSGSLLGAAVGVSTAVLTALDRRFADLWPAPVPFPIAVPWVEVGVLVVVVPLVTMAGTGLVTRSRLPVERP